MKARAPAKTILCGEHAVVYGQPALAVALKRYAWAEIERDDTLADGRLQLILSDLKQLQSIEIASLASLQGVIEQRYQQFLAGQLGIDQLLHSPAELYSYALSLCTSSLTALQGCRLRLYSDIPIGSGMGSSAATVCALIRVVHEWAAQPLSTASLARLTTRCEQLQHGRSSGLDPAICAQGGMLRFEQGSLAAVSAHLDPHWYLVDSGRPNDSTGQCTGQVRDNFAASAIWPEFGQACELFEQALQQADSDSIVAAMGACHRLLCRIGVVPPLIQEWITQLQQQGGAAKISGAGAISGERGGLVLVYCPTATARAWLEQQPYPWQTLEMDPDGARSVE